MNKSDYRGYLNEIYPYLNISAVCQKYNKTNKKKIDYNNLRSFVKNNDDSKLSIHRLEDFTNFIKYNIGFELILQKKNEDIIRKHVCELKREVIEILEKYEGEDKDVQNKPR